MWDFPGPGLEPVSPALAGRFLTTAPPGKPNWRFFYWEISPGLWWILFISLLGLGRWTSWQSFYYRFLAGLDCWLRKHTFTIYKHTHTYTNTRVYTQAWSSDNLNHDELGSTSPGREDSCLTRLLKPTRRQRLHLHPSQLWCYFRASLLFLSAFGERYQSST